MNQNTTQKTTRKLQLNRETVRELDTNEARKVVGGAIGYTNSYRCGTMTCPTTWC